MTSPPPGRGQDAESRFIQGAVRRLEEADIPQVAALYHRINGGPGDGPAPDVTAHFRRIFLEHPWVDPNLSSLVFEDLESRIIGCIGIMPRRLTFRGQAITAAVSHNFMVDPDRRSRMAAIALARRFLAGPQSLSLAEGNESSYRIWQLFGGSVSLLNSLSWTRPLRPAQYMLAVMGRRALPRYMQTLLTPAFRLADALPPLRGFLQTEPVTSEEALQPEQLCEQLGELSEHYELSPAPEKEAVAWQLQALATRNDGSTLHKVLLRNSEGNAVGWFVYYARRGGAGQVAQMGARQGWHNEVLAHLFHHAGREGVISLSGQMEPAFFNSLGRNHCFFHNDGKSWMLVHARRPEIINAIETGAAFLTRLEGEWWINYIHNN